MLALLKKNKSQTNSKDAGAAWRPDFRNVGLLPDTKTVRTSFMMNIIVFTLLSGSVLFSVYREFTLAAVKRHVASAEEQINTAKGPSNMALAEYKKFQAEEKKLADARSLVASNFSFPDYLIHLASLMPGGVRAGRVEFRGTGQSITVTGSIDGQDAVASETANGFITSLQQDEDFKNIFSSISNSNLGRNATTGTLNFELIFTFKKPAAPTPAKK